MEYKSIYQEGRAYSLYLADGSTYPVASAEMVYLLGGDINVMCLIPVGHNVDSRGQEVSEADYARLRNGSAVTLKTPYVTFNGYIGGISLSAARQPSIGSNSYISMFSVSLVSKLSRLAAYALANTRFHSKANLYDVQTLTESSETQAGIAGLFDFNMKDSIPQWIINLMTRLTEKAMQGVPEDGKELMEQYVPDKVLREGRKVALREFSSAFDVSTLIGNTYTKQLHFVWPNHTAKDSLEGMLNDFYLTARPTPDGEFVDIIPLMPLYKTPTYTIPSSEILKMDQREVLYALPFRSVWMMRTVLGETDANLPAANLAQTVRGFNDVMYISYPPIDKDTPSHAAILVTPSPLFSSVLSLENVSAKNAVGQDKSKGHIVGQQLAASAPQDTKDKEKELQESLDNTGLMLAKLLFGMKAFAQRSVTISVPAHMFSIFCSRIGDVVAVDAPDGLTLYGMIESVRHSASVQPSLSIATQVQISHIRTAEDNNKYGFTEHPLYKVS